MPSRLNQPAIRLADGVLNRAILDRPPVHEHMLTLDAPPRKTGQPRQPPQRKPARIVKLIRVHLHHLRLNFLAKNAQHALSRPLPARVLLRHAAIHHQREPDRRMRERELLKHIHAPFLLRLHGPQKLPPRGRVEEQIPHRHARPHRPRRRLRRPVRGPLHLQHHRSRLPPRARTNRHPRHRRDACQRLAPKPQRPDVIQIARLADLAGRVGRNCERQIVRLNPRPIIRDPHQFNPARLQLHHNPRRPRIQRVLDEFLHHRRRPLHNLACRDLIGHQRRQRLDPPGDSTTHAVLLPNQTHATPPRVE